MDQPSDETRYVVVENDEEQFSIWPAFREVPPGWKVRGDPALKESCLDFIREHWLDMRPRSLRVALAAQSSADASQ